MYIEYTSPRAGFELPTLVVICTDGLGSCKSKYHTIMITTAAKENLSLFFFILLTHNSKIPPKKVYVFQKYTMKTQVRSCA